MKKQNKKSQKKHNKYNGRNIYGQRCIAKDLKLEPRIAYQQAIQMIDEVFASKDKIEYTLDWSAVSDEEMDIVQEKMTRYWNLRQMYAYGNISPGEERCRPNSEYSKVFREMEKCENQLKEKLDAEGWKTFQQFTKAQMEASSLSDCDSFISGFRLGAKVIMDVLLTPSVLK